MWSLMGGRPGSLFHFLIKYQGGKKSKYKTNSLIWNIWQHLSNKEVKVSRGLPSIGTSDFISLWRLATHKVKICYTVQIYLYLSQVMCRITWCFLKCRLYKITDNVHFTSALYHISVLEFYSLGLFFSFTPKKENPGISSFLIIIPNSSE